ncbi:MAG: N-acetylmuramoyl-L-alanine amidase [Nostocaceae cyanobacterium]|nr:N-acetylmuramoyl-L-alanine amidase [Nostocaceae cyanobacterium]
MKIHWLLPATVLSVCVLSSPTYAAQLQSWRFDANQNRLEIETSESVQPQAQLIFNPTRLVIDLPGTTFERPQLTQPVGGAIRAIRVGQFEPGTARVVVELSSGYTIDPNQVKFVETGSSKWIVELPKPKLDTVASSSTNIYSVVTTNSKSTIDNKDKDNHLKNIISRNSQTTQVEGLLVTGDGFFIRTSGSNPQVQINPTRDKDTVNIDIAGATLSPSLKQNHFPVNPYGVRRIQFFELDTKPPTVRMTLQVNRNNTDWRTITSSRDGFVLLPNRASVKLPASNTPISNSNFRSGLSLAKNYLGTIQAVELSNIGRQLIIRSDRNISASGSWDRSTGLYKITIPNARLPEAVKGPSLNANSPILRIRLQQQDPRTVVIYVQPALGVKIGNLNNIGDRFVSLELQRNRSSFTPPIALPPLLKPNPQPLPPIANNPPWQKPTQSLRPLPKGRVLIVVDPGHGGKDSGAPGLGGLLEKDVVLSISKRVAALLQQNGIQAVLTRDSDYFVTLRGRVDIARRQNANLFVSIHANAIGGRPHVNGLETYYYQNGQRLAQAVHKRILRSISTIKDRRVRQARFYVLRKNSMPAILVETGYMTGREDNPRLKNPDYQNRMAEAIANGILDYLRQR